MINDETLIKRILERDESVLSDISDKYGAYMSAIAHRILMYDEDVEECINDTLYSLWNSVIPNNPSNLKAFIGKIIRNKAIDKTRTNEFKVQKNRVYTESMEELSDLYSAVNGPDAFLDEISLREEINSFLERCSKKNRIIFLLRYWEYMSTSEIALKLEISQKKVINSLAYTRLKLRKHLENRGFVI